MLMVNQSSSWVTSVVNQNNKDWRWETSDKDRQQMLQQTALKSPMQLFTVVIVSGTNHNSIILTWNSIP